MDEKTKQLDTVELAADLTIAWLSNPSTRASVEDVASFLGSIHSAVTGLSVAEPASVEQPAPEAIEPATTVRKSLASKEHIISLIDGKPYKTLRRHLTGHGFTPESYRERFGLKPDYPMVAPSYSESRSAMAKKIGLGRKR